MKCIGTCVIHKGCVGGGGGGKHNPHNTNVQGQTKNLFDIKKILSKVRTKKAIWLRFLVNAAILINKNYTSGQKTLTQNLKLSYQNKHMHS